jgi:hypothetical protein
MDLLYSWLGTEKTTYKYGNFQYIFSTSSDGNHPKSFHFHFFFSISFIGDILLIEIRMVVWF